MKKSPAEWEQQGYDAYLELWANDMPRGIRECPALEMPYGEYRQAYARGWLRARDEVRE